MRGDKNMGVFETIFRKPKADLKAEGYFKMLNGYTPVFSNAPESIYEMELTVAKTGALTAANVRTLIGLLPSGYDRNGKFVMNKKTLFTDFMPLQDNSKNHIVTVQNNAYFVYGYAGEVEEGGTRRRFHYLFRHVRRDIGAEDHNGKQSARESGRENLFRRKPCFLRLFPRSHRQRAFRKARRDYLRRNSCRGGERR